MFALRSLSLLQDRLSLIMKRDDLNKFKLLLASDKRLLNREFHNYDAESVLILAISCKSWNIFNYLLSLDVVIALIREPSHYMNNPLDLAMKLHLKRFVAKLIEKGCYVSVLSCCECYNNPYYLHTAIKNEWLDITDALIERGTINLDTLDRKGQTPLYIACKRGLTLQVSKLLSFGANPFINDSDNWSCADELAISEDKQLQELFLNKLLPRCEALHVDVFSRMMVEDSPIFVALLNRVVHVKTCNKMYNRYQFFENIAFFKPEFFKMFVDKFAHVVKEIFTCYMRCEYGEYTFPRHLDTLSKNNILYRYLQNLNCIFNLASSLPRSDKFRKGILKSKISTYISIIDDESWTEDDLHKIICVLLTNGINPCSTDLDAVYKRFGYCELFKTMLHMDIEDVDLKKQNILPRLIYDMNVTVEKYLRYPQLYDETDSDYEKNLLILCNFSALPKTRHRDSINEELALRIEKLPDVPSLAELARNTIRDHIINKLQIRKSMKFHTVLKHLPVAEVHKRIIAFEKEIYSV